MKLLLKVFLVLISCNLAVAQENDTIKKDSLKIYHDIKEVAKKRKATYWVYKVIFKDPTSITPDKVEQKQKKEKDKYKSYSGKIIRKIEFVSLDPFGTQLNDTLAYSENPIEKFGNIFHIATKSFAINNNLLFKQGDRIDPLKIKESERILRQAEYIREAKIDVYPIAGTDSADVLVAVQDVWSLEASGSASTSKSTLKLKEKNFVGTGHNLNNNFNFNFKERPAFFLSGDYNVPNVHHTFISSTIYYNTSNLNKYLGLNLQRPFYSPLTHWAGGVNVMQNRGKLLIASEDGTTHFSNLRYGYEDYWIGRSFKYKKGDSDEDRGSRLVVAARMMNRRFTERPEDPALKEIYQNSTLVLGSVGISTRTYYKDWNIYRFSQTEDVPEGLLISFTGGIEKREMADRKYVGAELAAGSHIQSFGYFARSLQVGSFINFSNAEDGTVKVDLSYFTDLFTFGKWNFRQFVKYRFTHGFNWAQHANININNEFGLYGFNSPTLAGKNKMVLNLESVFYLPYNILGFQFAPVLLGGFGILGTEEVPLTRSKVYQFYGIGLLIRNELLIASNFQLSIGFYPEIPGIGNSKIKFNPISNYDYNFREFYLAQPAVVPFD